MRSVIKLCNYPGNSKKRNRECNKVIPAVLDLIQNTKALLTQKKNRRRQYYNPFVHVDHLHVAFHW
jgi:hypothetical protein